MTVPLALARACTLCKPALAAKPARAAPRGCVCKCGSVHADIGEVLLTPTDIASRIAEVGKRIAADYADKRPIVVGTLKGATIFMSDLVRALDPPPPGTQLEFIRASSYGAGTESSGSVALTVDTLDGASVVGRHVLLVEDIVDSGRTAAALVARYTAAGAASVALASLLSKPSRRVVSYEPDYLCFEVEDKFVVGYGLDFDEHYRELPYVGVLRPECYGGEGEA